MLGGEQEGTFDFVVIPGVGYEANYTGIDIEGKVAVVRRGGNSFEQKVKIAANMGAKGVIIYNNVSGMLNMSVGTKEVIPSCLISMDYGDILVELGQGTITVTYDPANRPGVFSKELTVYSSERKKIAALTVQGRVTPRPKRIEELYPVDAGGGLRLASTLNAFAYIHVGVPVQGAIGYVNEVLARARHTANGDRSEPADWPTSLTQEQVRDDLRIERRCELKGELLPPESLDGQLLADYNYTCRPGDCIKTCTVPSPQLNENDLVREKRMLEL